MRIAITGGTGFLGRYIIRQLAGAGHRCPCWYRPTSDRSGFENFESNIEWVEGNLTDKDSIKQLVTGCDAVVHSALYRSGSSFRSPMDNLPEFVKQNVLGTIELVEEAKRAGVKRFIFISTCAVHERILDDRKLDEAHPLWPTSHYGAHKAAIEKFIHSYGLGEGYEICSLRPTGIYGEASPVQNSKWFDLVSRVVLGEAIASAAGGKEVHAADVAKAVEVLLTANGIAGQAYNCYDMYIAEQDVARIARSIANVDARIENLNKGPKHQIETSKLRSLGMSFGGEALLNQTVASLVQAVRKRNR